MVYTAPIPYFRAVRKVRLKHRRGEDPQRPFSCFLERTNEEVILAVLATKTAHRPEGTATLAAHHGTT